MRKYLLVIIVLTIGFGTDAFSSGSETDGGNVKSEGDHHWSIADYFIPMTLIEFAKANFGKSIVEHRPVEHITHVAFALVVFIIILTLLLSASARLKKAKQDMLPQSRFNPLTIFEMVADTLLGLMEGIMGRERALRFLPLIGSLGVFILISNLMGLIPGFLPPTDNLNTTFALGSVVFVATHYYGVKAHGIAYFKHFLGPIIKWYAFPLMILMLIIETISHFARPVSLAIRLLGNIFGDHAVMAAAIGSGLILVPVPAIVLGLFVSVVQAAVFCILSTVYIALATQEEEHGKH